MKNRLIFFIVWGFFYICLVMLWSRQYQILTVSAKEIGEHMKGIDIGFNALDEEIEQDSNSVLHDNIQFVALNEEDYRENYSNDYTEDPDGDSFFENQSDNEEISDMNDNQFRIMVIFCFGLSIGVIVGHFLTGFIK